MRHVCEFRRFYTAALAMCVVFALASPALAQTDVTTSRISGVVNDATDAALPGVTVEAKNQETGFVASSVTGSDGAYRIINLPTGKYTVSSALDGFNTVTRPNVDVKLGQAPTINFTMQLSTVSETLTVTSSAPLVEVTNTSASTTIETEEIKDLPLNGRNFVDLVYLTPETRRERERGNIAISGQRGINTNVTVDGVDYNNSFFGGTAGTAEGRAPLSISQESVKEFTVITNGASVEFGRSAGGFVNVITKSGTNQMHGSAFYYTQPQSLISDFADGRQPADQKKAQYGGSLGGPIMQDKMFYFASYDEQKQDQTSPISTTVLDSEIFARYPVLASDSDFVQTTDGRVIFGRLDYQATPAHRFMARGNYTTYTGDHGTSGATNRSSLTNGVEGLDSRTYVGSWSGTFGGSLLNDLNVTYSDEFTPRNAVPGSENLPEIIMGNTTTYGGVSFLPIISTVQRQAIADTVSFLWKNHVLKAGFDYNDTSVDQIFKGNWRGVFQFTGTFAQAKAKLLAGKWDQYRQFGGLGGLTADQAGGVSYGQTETALFLQDQWYLRPNLTISAGVRYEKLDNPDAPVLNPNDRNANGSFKNNAQIPDVDDQISPRLGVTWSPLSRTVLRGTIGRYWSRTPALLWAQLYSSNGLRGTQYIINASGGNCPTDPLSPGWGAASDNCRGPWTPEGTERIDFTKVTNIATPGVFVVDPDFTNPRTDRFTFGVEQEVMTETAVGLDYTYAESENLERLTDINLQYQRNADGSITLGANGRPRYSSTRPNLAYGRITTYTSDARSEYWALTATARRRFAQGFRAFANVTYSHDKDNDSNERNFSGIQAEDVNDLDGTMWGYSERDQRWRGAMSFIWDTPWWGIGVSGAYTYSTGQAYSARFGSDANNDGNNVDRPTIGGEHLERNSFRQPDFSTISLRIGKGFRLGPGDLTVFGECFNCADSANRSIAAGNQTWGNAQTPSATFGVVDQVTLSPRTIQLAVRYDF